MKYIAYIKSRIRIEKFYKLNLYTTLISSLMIFFIEYELWKAVYNNNNELGGLSFNQMFIYIVFGNILRKLLGEGVDEEIGEMYRSGSIVKDMVRPINIVLKILFDDLGRGLYQMCIISVPILFVFFIKDAKDFLSIHQIIFFVMSIFLAYILSFLLSYVLGLVTFWTHSNIGIYMLKVSCIGILSGLYIPLDLYPNWLYKLAEVLPFRAMYYLPTSVIMKEVTSQQIISNFGIQIFWILVMSLLLFFVQKKALNRLTVQGG